MPEWRENPDDIEIFRQRLACGVVTELFIQELRILVASELTTEGVDNYPILVIVPQRRPGQTASFMEEFYIIPLTPKTLSDDGNEILPQLKANSILVAAGNLFSTVYGPDDSEKESEKGLTFPER